MPGIVIDKKVIIHAPVKKTWSVFTVPEITKQMGGEYVSDWKVGSPVGWKASDGNMYTRGFILAIEPGKQINITSST